ncbi:polysaccharide deacetylase family protein [Flavonifractor sp. An100]|uniref:polysaccharide deacetylase family protein n=1 Tax=Flavonifractor sp. An100 TaxID=1965538 RepID=UPI000B3A8166|nr:polysaccharide deacetylase family protein [Flavonifractor sp. An100]OUQ82282.1 hypothetical protein B5E43_00440 [Flavonifractor sp. An100]
MKRKWTIGLAALVLAAIVGAAVLVVLHRMGTAVPVLMYHHFIQEGPSEADTVVTAQRFGEQVKALREAGYTAVTPEQVIRYVDGKEKLPEKPVMITIDDGYTSNLEIAAPILERYGMKATIFVIGINVGQTVYPHTGQALDPPRFSWDQVRPWVEKGVICVQSHTYDLHQRSEYGLSGRDGVLRISGESEEEYIQTLREDLIKAREGLRQGLGVELDALAFPFGLYSSQAVEELAEQGVRMTFSTNWGCRRVVPGWNRTLQCMERMWICDGLTGEELLSKVQDRVARARVDLF